MYQYYTELHINGILDILQRASRETGLVVDYTKSVEPSIASEGVFVASFKGEVCGFLVTMDAYHPDTGVFTCIEKMLFVDMGHRGMRVSEGLLECAERVAIRKGCRQFLAGSSLNTNSLSARRVYERAGFATTYTFQKELPQCV